MQLELNPAAIPILRGRGTGCRDTVRLDPGSAPHGLCQNLLFCFELVRIGDMLPRTAAASSEEWTGRCAALGRGSDQFNNLCHLIGTFFSSDSKSHLIVRAAEGHKADFAVDAADAITAEGEFIDRCYKVTQVNLPEKIVTAFSFLPYSLRTKPGAKSTR